MALGFCAATVMALVVGGTRHDETAATVLQMALALAMLAVMWTLVGIMFTLARPAAPGSSESEDIPAAKRHAHAAAEPKGVNWFQDATAGTASRH